MSFMDRFRRQNTVIGEVLTFSDDEHSFSAIAEVHLTSTEQREEEGFVVKEILRTGEWPVIPTKNGVVKKPLKIVRNGPSSEEEGTISLEEIVENFKKVGINVQVPLSDDEDDDHKNLTKLNTGFVRDLWITDEATGSKLVAKIEFTEPEVKDKVLNGTYADVSCGIPWEVLSRGEKYGTTLEHVAITNRPFIDGLGGFLALSDKTKDAKVVHFAEPKEEVKSTELTHVQMLESAQKQIGRILGENFKVLHIAAEGFFVRNEELKTSWSIPFTIEEGDVKLATISNWNSTKDEEGKADPGEQKPPAPIPPVTEPKAGNLPTGPEGELEAARRLREARLGSSEQSTFTNGGGNMPLTREEMEALNLSELPEGQRVVFQKILDENSALAASNKEKQTEKRVKELEELGLKDKPGALKLYRRVMLADDGGPAVVALSDDGKTKESLTALSILDQFIEAIAGADKKVHLSDQALVSGSDIKPPETPEGEKKPLEERKAEMKAALFGGVK